MQSKRLVLLPLGVIAALLSSIYGVAADPNSTQPAAVHGEKSFLDENTAAMNKMMKDMDVKPTGDVDRDFVAMMVPHHQGAIDMAQVIIRHGRNETLKRLAQEIIVTQQQEIAAMRLAVGQPLPPSTPSPTGAAPATAPATMPTSDAATRSAHAHQ